MLRMETVYIETSVVSLLVANPSRDVIIAGQQQATRDWWQLRRDSFACITSDETRAEAARGDAEQGRLRLTTLAEFPSLPITPEVENLAAEFLRTGRCLRRRVRMPSIWPSPPSCRGIIC